MAEGEDPAEAAASEAAKRAKRKPAVTIDLEAAGSAVSPEPAPAEERPATPVEPPPNVASGGTGFRDADYGVASPPARQASAGALLGFAVIGALVTAIAFYLLMFTDVLPSPGRTVADEAKQQATEIAGDLAIVQQALAAQDDEIGAALGAIPAPDLSPVEARLGAVESALGDLPGLRAELDQMAATVASLGETLAAEQAARQQLASALEALRRETVAAAAAAGDPDAAVQLGEDINALSARLTALENTATAEELAALRQTITVIGARLDAFEAAASPEDLQALRQDFAAIETMADELSERMDALAADAETRGQTQATARALAVANLRNAAAGDGPFLTELAILTEFGVPADQLQAIEAAARSGVPSVATLAAEFPDVASAILSADNAVDPEASFLERFWQNARSAVVIEPTTPVEGDDPPAIVSRMRAAIAEGDLAAALAEREALPEEALAVSEDWAGRAAERVALDQAIEALSASTLGQTIE